MIAWILYIIFVLIELLGLYGMINEVFFELDYPKLGCMYGELENGRVEITDPRNGQVYRYDNFDVCYAEQTYMMAMAFLIFVVILVIKLWLIVVLFYYQSSLKKE